MEQETQKMSIEFAEVKTAELEGVALDWAVGKSAGINLRSFGNPKYGLFIPNKKGFVDEIWVPSTSWAQCGPLIERFKVDLVYERAGLIAAYLNNENGYPVSPDSYGNTHLIAVCRAIVAHALGEIVSVPKEFM